MWRELGMVVEVWSILAGQNQCRQNDLITALVIFIQVPLNTH